MSSHDGAAGASITHGVRPGERQDPETHLIPIEVEVAAGSRSALDMNGLNCPTADGSCVRDSIHVVDLADARVRALSAARRARAEVGWEPERIVEQMITNGWTVVADPAGGSDG